MSQRTRYVLYAGVLLTAVISGCISFGMGEPLSEAEWHAVNALPRHDPDPPPVLIGSYIAPALDGRDMWVWSGSNLVKIDPVTGHEIMRSEKLSEGRYAVGGNALWLVPINIFSKQVVRKVDAQTGKLVAEIPMDAWRVAADRTSIWVADRKHGALIRIDPDSNAVLATIPVGSDVDGLAVGEGGVWVSRSEAGYVTRIDPQTNQVVAQIRLPSRTCSTIATGEGGVWLAASSMNSIIRIDPDTNRCTKIPVGAGPMCLAVGGGSVWTATTGVMGYRGTFHYLVRVAPHTNQAVESLMVHDVLQPIEIGQSIMTADERGLWVVLVHHSFEPKLWYLRR